MTLSWLIFPVAIPAMTAAFLVLAARRSLTAQRSLSILATVAQLALAIGLYVMARDGAPHVYWLGHWPAPFGIVLVLDRLSATMLLLTAFLAIGVVLAATGEWDKRGRHFHALFQFQLLGINGAFLTGDLFNLFVFFEVLLIASYGLMLHGAGAKRMKAGFHYVAINLIGSTVFLFAAGLIYAVVGTLNFADLAAKVPQVTSADQPLLAAGALLLLAVFAIKSSLVPLHWWLPPTYGSTLPPVAALFAIMTKVGVYSIIRVFTLVFGADAGGLAQIASPWLLPAAIVTLVLGTIGVLASRNLRTLTCYSLIASTGTLLIGIGLFTAPGLASGLYYLLQSTLASAALFLLVGVVLKETDNRTQIIRFPQHASLLAGLYFCLAIASVGMPPLAGFIGKLLILDAGRAAASMASVWPAILITSLLMIIGFATIGIRLFWNTPTTAHAPEPDAARLPVLTIAVIGAMIIAIAALSVFAGPVMNDMTAATDQLLAPRNYIDAVLRPPLAMR